jgi:threonine/homoserine/homoserine lactone efflux protein
MPPIPWSDFAAVWMLLALNIATPGPNVLATIAAAIGSGRAAGLGSAAGVGLGIAGWCLGASLGLAALFAAWPGAEAAMTLLAAGLLGWFALRYLRAAHAGWRGGARLLPGTASLGPRGAFLRALAVNATNPKALTTWIAILAVFPVARADAGDILMLTAGASLLSLSIHTAYALAFSSPPAMRAYLRAAPAVNAGVGVFFALFAGALVGRLATGA